MSKVIIRSAGPSFRRAGVVATRAGVVYDETDLTKAQKEAIINEPQLSAAPFEDESEKKEAKAKK